MAQTDIKFYDPKAPYYEFSNFYGVSDNSQYKLFIDGQSWRSTEHYYQSQKFNPINATEECLAYSYLIASADTPNKAYVLARQKTLSGYTVNWKHSKQNTSKLSDLIKNSLSVGITMRQDWDQVKDEIMLKANRCKYEQNEGLKQLLLSTGNLLLIEHTSRDSYWGDGGN